MTREQAKALLPVLVVFIAIIWFAGFSTVRQYDALPGPIVVRAGQTFAIALPPPGQGLEWRGGRGPNPAVLRPESGRWFTLPHLLSPWLWYKDYLRVFTAVAPGVTTLEYSLRGQTSVDNIKATLSVQVIVE